MGLKSKKALRILLVMALVISMSSIAAFANTDSVSIYVHDISANTDTLLATYDRADLENSSQFATIATHNYSTYTCKPSYQYYTARGPELQEVLNAAFATTTSGITLADVGQIDINADGYSISTTKSDLLDTTRSWYNTSHVWQATTPAILATKVANGLNVTDSALGTSYTIRDFYGQKSATDYTVLNFVKDTATITLYVQ